MLCATKVVHHSFVHHQMEEGTEIFTGPEFRLAHALTHGPVVDIHRALRDITVNPNHLPNCFWNAQTPNTGSNYIDAVSTFLWTNSEYEEKEDYDESYWTELFDALMQRKPLITGPELAQTVLDLDLFRTRPIWFFYLVRQGFQVDSWVHYQDSKVTLAYFLLIDHYFNILKNPEISPTVRGETRIMALLVARITRDPLITRMLQPIPFGEENPSFFQSLDSRLHFFNLEFQMIAPEGLALATMIPDREPLRRWGAETDHHRSLHTNDTHSLITCQASSVAAASERETVQDYMNWYTNALREVSLHVVSHLPSLEDLPAPWLIETQPDRKYSTFLRLILCNATIWEEEEFDNDSDDRWYLFMVEAFDSWDSSSTYQEEGSSNNPALETSPLLDRLSRLGKNSVLYIPNTVEHVVSLDLWLLDTMPEPAFRGFGAVPFFVYLVTEVFVSIERTSPKKRTPLSRRSKRPFFKIRWVDWQSIYNVFSMISNEDWDSALLNSDYLSATRAKLRLINNHVREGRMPGGGRQ